MRLYDYLPSQNGYKVRQLLHHLGLEYETRIVQIFRGESHTAEFLAKNPAGAIPVLELSDGRTIAESNAILCFLAEGTPYLPTDVFQRAQVMQWLFFEQDYLQPSIGTLRYWTLTDKLERHRDGVAPRRARGEAVLRALDAALTRRDFLAVDRYTIADIGVFAYGALAGEAGFDLAPYPAFRAWTERVRAQANHLSDVHYYAIDPFSGRDLPVLPDPS